MITILTAEIQKKIVILYQLMKIYLCRPIVLIKNRLVFNRNTTSSIYLLEIGRLVSVLFYHIRTFLNKINRAVVN